MFKGSLSKIFASINNHIITKQTNKKGGLKILNTSRIKLKKYMGLVNLISGLVSRRPISLDPKLHFCDVALRLLLFFHSLTLPFRAFSAHSQPTLHHIFYLNKWKFLQRERLNSHRISLEHQHGRHFILDTNMIVYFILDPEKWYRMSGLQYMEKSLSTAK